MGMARKLVFVGGLVVAAAVVATGWMPNVQGTMLTYGVIAGNNSYFTFCIMPVTSLFLA